VPAITVSDLKKTYEGSPVLDGVSFEVERGEVFALLGPNGAGKSTTIEIIEGHRRRSGGEVSVLGVDPETGGRSHRDRIGIVLQDSGIEDQLTVREAIDIYASAYSRPRSTQELLEMVDLDAKADARVKTLSGGQRRRIDLALGIVGNPDVLFLDEPTTGFDPAARRNSWDLIDGLRSQGTTILLTTHYMDEVARLADRVAVIVGGSIVAEGTPSSLVASLGDTRISFCLPATRTIADLPTSSVFAENERIVLVSSEPTSALFELTNWALQEGIELQDLTVSKPSLEDAYLALANPVEVRA
jgi:ABC-type multidrug transport system ATPase subunit